MEKDIFLTAWSEDGDTVRLKYSDGAVAFVRKADFDRAFGTIISSPKEAVIRDFAIDD